MMAIGPVGVFLLITLSWVQANEEPIWKWVCKSGNCLKIPSEESVEEPALSLEACKMFCNEYGLLWPQPTGTVNLGNFLSKISLPKIKFEFDEKPGKSSKLMKAATQRFEEIILQSLPKGIDPKSTGKTLKVYLKNKNLDNEFSLDLDESYSLRVGTESADQVNATISANTFFGIRHGLESLTQLIIYDEIRNHVLIARDVTIDDKPKYPYRGILLDTSRNYYTLESIKRTINAMAVVKLNTFHWHITDTHSFPFVSERRPELSKLGALGPSKVYTKKDIQNIVEYGLERGVRVVPEFDAPAHVGEGWQNTNLTLCFKAEPWKTYCVEPPCGQLNPVKDELYDVLEDIYTDMAEAFQSDMLHMGGDEVKEKCWMDSQEIKDFVIRKNWGAQNKSTFFELWNYFQQNAEVRAYKAFGKEIPLILWTSTLTDFATIDKYLDKNKYIIQVWTTGSDPQIKGLLEKGYRLIISNYDALYFDCGFGAWIGEGNNWCSPYIGWQKVYDNSPAAIAKEYASQILGGEAALWSEQADSATLDGRLWPRAAALAERLWAEPTTDWRNAEQRFLHVRERLVRMNVNAESIEPEWCYQNEGYCY